MKNSIKWYPSSVWSKCYLGYLQDMEVYFFLDSTFCINKEAFWTVKTNEKCLFIGQIHNAEDQQQARISLHATNYSYLPQPLTICTKQLLRYFHHPNTLVHNLHLFVVMSLANVGNGNDKLAFAARTFYCRKRKTRTPTKWVRKKHRQVKQTMYLQTFEPGEDVSARGS